MSDQWVSAEEREDWAPTRTIAEVDAAIAAIARIVDVYDVMDIEQLNRITTAITTARRALAEYTQTAEELRQEGRAEAEIAGCDPDCGQCADYRDEGQRDYMAESKADMRREERGGLL